MRWRSSLVVLVPLFFVTACDRQPAGPQVDQTLDVPTFKVDRLDYTYDYDLDGDAPYPDCLGEAMQNHGVVQVFVRQRATPSGNVLVNGWVDYDAYGPVTLEGLSSGTVYTLVNGKNPFVEVIKENGLYLLHYHWNEVFRSQDGKKVNVHLQGHLKIEPDGTVKIDRESYRCN